MRVLSNHMFVAHKRQEQNHQQELGGRKRGRRRGARNQVPITNPLSGGGGLVHDRVHPMQETKVRENHETCKYGGKGGHEKSPNLEMLVQERLVQQKLSQEKLV